MLALRMVAPSAGVMACLIGHASSSRCDAAPNATPAAPLAPTPASQPEAEAHAIPAVADQGGERYAVYVAQLARLKVFLFSKGAVAGAVSKAKAVAADGARYVAYSSDVGESFRPVLKPWMVNATYGIAGVYVLGDCAHAVREKQLGGWGTDTLVATAVHRFTFHAIVSLAIPALVIHTAVHQSHNLFEHAAFAKFPKVVKWGPSAIGMAIIPFLPLMDPPAEHVIDAAFDKILPAWKNGEKPHAH